MRIKKSKIPIIIGATLLLVIIIIVIAQLVNNNKKIDYSKLSDEEKAEIINEQLIESQMNKISEMKERERIEYYVTEFITAIENKDYDVAYEMLYEDFRKNFFPKSSDFTEYAKNKFPSTIITEHTNIERNGNTYVLWVNLSNPIAGKSSSKEINFVVQENGLNDFKLSFSVF